MADHRFSPRKLTDMTLDEGCDWLHSCCESLLLTAPMTEHDLAEVLQDLANWYGHCGTDLDIEACDEPILVSRLRHLKVNGRKGGAQ